MAKILHCARPLQRCAYGRAARKAKKREAPTHRKGKQKSKTYKQTQRHCRSGWPIQLGRMVGSRLSSSLSLAMKINSGLGKRNWTEQSCARACPAGVVTPTWAGGSTIAILSSPGPLGTPRPVAGRPIRRQEGERGERRRGVTQTKTID